MSDEVSIRCQEFVQLPYSLLEAGSGQVHGHKSQPRDLFDQLSGRVPVERPLKARGSVLHAELCRTLESPLGALTDRAERQAAFSPSFRAPGFLFSSCLHGCVFAKSQCFNAIVSPSGKGAVLWDFGFCIKCEARIFWALQMDTHTQDIQVAVCTFFLFSFFFLVFLVEARTHW